MANYRRIISMALAGVILTGVSVFPAGAQDELLPDEPEVFSYSIFPEDPSEDNALTSFEFTLPYASYVTFTVDCETLDVPLHYGVHGEELPADFNWRNTSSLQYPFAFFDVTEETTQGTIYYVLAPGTYNFWLESSSYTDWETPVTGTVTIDGYNIEVNAPYSENRTRENAAAIELDTHYQSVVTAEYNDTDMLVRDLYTQWYEFMVPEDGIYYFIGEITAAASDDAGNVVMIYKDGEASGDPINLQTTYITAQNGRTICARELEAGTYQMEVRPGIVNDGGIAYDLGVYPFTRGDANLDGNIDLSDASAVLSYYAKNAAGMDAAFTDGSDSYAELRTWLQGDATRYNWTTSFLLEDDDIITLDDATAILGYYAQSAAGMEPSWD